MSPTVRQAFGPDALQAAIRSDAEWVWALERGARPHDEALDRLIQALAPEPDCVVAAGLVVDDEGSPIELLIPAGTESDSEKVIRLAQRRLLPIRNATFAHTLVRRDALVRHGAPDHRRYGTYAGIEWTARVLRDEGQSGIFVPLSIVVADRPRPRVTDLPAVIRTARTPTWTRGETTRQLRAFLSPSRAW